MGGQTQKLKAEKSIADCILCRGQYGDITFIIVRIIVGEKSKITISSNK